LPDSGTALVPKTSVLLGNTHLPKPLLKLCSVTSTELRWTASPVRSIGRYALTQSLNSAQL